MSSTCQGCTDLDNGDGGENQMSHMGVGGCLYSVSSEEEEGCIEVKQITYHGKNYTIDKSNNVYELVWSSIMAPGDLRYVGTFDGESIKFASKVHDIAWSGDSPRPEMDPFGKLIKLDDSLNKMKRELHSKETELAEMQSRADATADRFRVLTEECEKDLVLLEEARRVYAESLEAKENAKEEARVASNELELIPSLEMLRKAVKREELVRKMDEANEAYEKQMMAFKQEMDALA